MSHQPPALRAIHPNGLLTAPQLDGLVSYCLALGKTELRLGSRNDILIPKDAGQSGGLERALADLGFWTDPTVHSLVNSMAGLGLQNQTSWLTEGTYLDVLRAFVQPPRLPIALLDPLQGFWPRLQIGLNFLASAVPDFWQLFVITEAIPEPLTWPWLIDSASIAQLCFVLEDELVELGTSRTDHLIERVGRRFTGRSRIEKTAFNWADVPDFYGEGLLADRRGGFYLGVLGTNDGFRLDFLRAVARLVLAKGNGRIYLTPWKSLLIKDIKEADRRDWENLCGDFGLNLRHPAQTFGWRSDDDHPWLNRVKADLIRTLVRRDIRTFGFRFHLLKGTGPRTTPPLHGSERVALVAHRSWRGPRFDLWADLTSSPWMTRRQICQDLSLAEVATNLAELNQTYYHLRQNQTPPAPLKAPPPASPLYRCRDCLTIYDQRLGVPRLGIAAGLSLSDLPEDFGCEVCGADKGSYQLVV